MAFDQYIHAICDGAGLKFGGLCVIQSRHDQQYRIGTEAARFDNLQRVDDKIFTQYRQADSGPRRNQIFRRTLKPVAVGQH